MGVRILLVDDDADSLRVTARLCEMDGHTVHTAGTVREALDVQARERCELLVTDLGLPDGTGNGLADQLRAAYGLPAVALTGFQQSDAWPADGFASYLVKPILYDKLKLAIADAVAGATPGRLTASGVLPVPPAAAPTPTP